MSKLEMKRTTVCVGGDSLASMASKLWRHQTLTVRFWIITMMLVLIGLSTLKLR
jgi:UDP-N-acetylmuramyl pentapeptide phosphotransferase/UDP-N-acetylglucosamine-1-phosphate transferase